MTRDTYSSRPTPPQKSGNIVRLFGHFKGNQILRVAKEVLCFAPENVLGLVKKVFDGCSDSGLRLLKFGNARLYQKCFI